MSILSETWLFSSDVKEDFFGNVPEKTLFFRVNEEHGINLDTVDNRKRTGMEEVLLFNRFSTDHAMDAGLGFGVDWWCELFLNGKKIYTNYDLGGNQASMLHSKNHRIVLHCLAGENLLTVRAKRGTAPTFFAFFEELDPASCDPCTPVTVTVDPETALGPIRMMNAVNNGPIRGRSDQTRGNFELWKAAKIPMARNHDAAFCSAYGGAHAVDISAVFPDFSANPEDPASYDFTLTDWCIKNTMDAGTEVFYRLGSRIEHNPKKYGTKPPEDFRKWAVVCEHIIRHFNEGWADGHHWNIRYWEIWNEPDDFRPVNATWQGTPEQFFELFRITACHLKKCFPNLKIGGPALGGNLVWLEMFLKAITEGERVPMDFFSWHRYTTNPESVMDYVRNIRSKLDRYGYEKTESILNEWNFVRDWGKDFVQSIKAIISIKGAVYTASVMSVCQDSPLDMLMYYDARPCAFNGLFDFYTYEPLKGYYPFVLWSRLTDLGTQVKAETGEKYGLYVTAASKNGHTGIMLCRYFPEDELPAPLELTLKLKGNSLENARAELLDRDNDLKPVSVHANPDGSITFSMNADSVLWIETR